MLVVDDEKNITIVIRAILEAAGFEVETFNDSKQALQAIGDEGDFDALVTDLYMPNMDGMALLDQCKARFPQLPVIMITAFGTVEAAVNALKRGAFDFITKPFEKDELLNTVSKAVKTSQSAMSEPAEVRMSSIGSVIGQSESIQEVFRVVAKVAASPSTVLIHGESGTGKELIAFEIHSRSQRAKKPFIKVNCAAIPPTLIESELFGYEKGAFTGAVTSKPGRFELAHEGTLFLDEVADMPLEMQVKLLRVLQEQEFERVGGVNTIHVDVRIIAASNKDLPTEIKAGRFRDDLYYRLNVVPIVLPPLRDRKEDVELLVNHFIEQFNSKLSKKIEGIKEDALQVLREFSWPGNIRQLENMIERMMLMAEGSRLTLRDIPQEILAGMTETEIKKVDPEGEGFREAVKRQTQSVERELIEKALKENNGNITRTAEKLGLSRKGLQLKMKELGISRTMDGSN